MLRTCEGSLTPISEKGNTIALSVRDKHSVKKEEMMVQQYTEMSQIDHERFMREISILRNMVEDPYPGFVSWMQNLRKQVGVVADLADEVLSASQASSEIHNQP